jgi:hypothetical protein
VQLSAALRWRHDFIKLANTLAVSAQTVLPHFADDDALIEVFRLECLRVHESPRESLIAKLIQATEGQVLSLHSEHTRSACRSKHEVLKLRGLRHPAADPLELVKSHVSTDWKIRLAIAGNVAASDSILEKLGNDTHHLVAVQAISTRTLKAKGLEGRNEVLKIKSSLSLAPLAEEISYRLRAIDISYLVSLFDEPWWSRFRFSQKHLSRIQWSSPGYDLGLNVQEKLRVIEVLSGDPSEEICWPADESSPFLVRALEILSSCESHSDRASVAYYENVPSEILKKLAKDRSLKVRQAVSENRSTPPSALVSLSRLSPVDIRVAIAGNPSTPDSTLEKLFEGADTRLCAALKEGTNRDVSSEARVIANVTINPSASDQLRLKTLECMVSHASNWARRFAAEVSSITPSLLEKLCQDQDQMVRKAVATNISTPPSGLSSLAKDVDLDVRRSVARNPSTPPEVLDALARDRKISLQIAVAGNPSCPLDTCLYLSKSVNFNVLGALARNDSTADSVRQEVLLVLAYSGDKMARRDAASNRLTPYELLAKLSYDTEFEVISALLENEACSKDLRVSAVERLSVSPHFADKRFAAKLTETPEAALRRLAQSDSETILVTVAENSSTPTQLRIDLLEKLWKSPEVLIRQAVASNATTPKPILVSMATRDFWPIRASAINNPSFPAELRAAARDSLLQEVLRSLEPPRPFTADELSAEDFHEPLKVLDLMPDAEDKKAVAKAAKAKDWVQRAAACLSPTISESALKRLVDDEVEMVKELAVWRLQQVCP